MKRKKKYTFLLRSLIAAALGLTLISGGLSADAGDPWPVTLRQQISRLNAVGFRIGKVAAPLCPATVGGTGIALDYIEAYEVSDRAGVAHLLNMSHEPQVAAVAPGSPAQAAGIRPGDALVEIAGTSVDQILRSSEDKSLFADELEQRINDLGTPIIVLKLRRGGEIFEAAMTTIPICSARFVIKTGLGIDAFSDGTNIAISSKLIEFSQNDDQLALIAGHEMGHVINRDDKATSLAARRTMEDRADIMGIRLLKCGGYDPDRGVQFWVRRNATDWLRMLRAPTHRSATARVELMRDEAPKVSCPPQPIMPLAKTAL